ncbi:MAG TPA: SpoIIE family protein phosphatase [Solirubrobacteraceae bacterium]|jgi:PAS domain S-box-containing protein
MDLDQASAILNYAHSAFISMDERGQILYWNIRAEEMFGLTRAEAIGQSVADTIIPEHLRDAHREGLRRFLQSGEARLLNRRLELRALRADGSEFPVELTVSALAEDRGWSFHAFVADISERRAGEVERQKLLDELQHALHGSEQRLEVIVNALAEAVTIRGLDDHIIYANRAALDRLGLASLEELRESDPRELMGPYETTGEDGREIRLEDLPSVRVVRGEEAEPLMLRSVHRSTGAEEWVLLKATPVRDAAGNIDAAVTIIENVTAAKRSSLRMEFLARASRVLASSLDYQQTLRNVASLAVPQIADWCAVDLFDEAGQREPVAVAHIDPAKLQMAERLRAFEPEELDPEQGIGRVRRTGESTIYEEIPDALLVEAAVSEEHLSLLRAVGMRAVLIVPMTVRGRTIGSLSLVSADSGRSFDQGDVELAEQIAEVAALAVENARLYSERTEVARTLQSSLLPEALPEVPGWEIAAHYRPAGHEAEVGGDFYDFWEIAGDWLMMIGDVTGKGVGAATVTSLVRHTAWAASDFDSRPAAILARVDAALKRRPMLSVCSALSMRVSEGRGTVASGGHPLPFHLSDGGVAELGSAGTLLGAFSKVGWPEAEFMMRPGDTLVAITDGVTDTVGQGDERFGTRRLRRVLEELHAEPPTVIRERLVAAIEEFQVGARADDTAIVIMRFNGAPAAEQTVARATNHNVGV